MEAPEENSIEKPSRENNSGICQRCGRLYTSNRISKKYCSDSCKTLACKEKKKEEQLAALKQSQINQANRQRIHQEELARKAENEAKQLAALSAQVKQRQDHFEKLQAEKKALAEEIMALELKHKYDLDILLLEEQLRREQFKHSQEKPITPQATKKRPKHPIPSGLKPLPEIKIEGIFQGISEFIKAFSPKNGQDLP
jgi:hypothetical protein